MWNINSVTCLKIKENISENHVLKQCFLTILREDFVPSAHSQETFGSV